MGVWLHHDVLLMFEVTGSRSRVAAEGTESTALGCPVDRGVRQLCEAARQRGHSSLEQRRRRDLSRRTFLLWLECQRTELLVFLSSLRSRRR